VDVNPHQVTHDMWVPTLGDCDDLFRRDERPGEVAARSGLDCGRDLKSPDAFDWLADVALHVGSLDPIEIAAGAILESSGHARGNEQLPLEAS
jgi:hypothetical protein